MDSTLIRRLDTTAMLVGPPGEVTEKVAASFTERGITVVRVAHSAAACERLAVAMPQVVVVLGQLHGDERDALGDRAMAVGALVIDVDPQIDEESLEDIVGRAGQAAVERKLLRDESGPAGAVQPESAPAADDGVDSGWGEH